MDDICAGLDQVIRRVDRHGPPPIPFAGRPWGGYANPPAPHLLLGLLLEPGIPDLDLGDRQVAIPARSLFLHSVHRGNRTPVQRRMSAWCVFLDVGGIREYAGLAQRSVFAAVPVSGAIPDLEVAFARLASACVRHGAGAQRYLAAGPMWDPVRHGRAGPTAAIYVKSALLELLAQARDAAIPAVTGAMPPAIQRALDYMGVHLADPALDLPRLAVAAGLSLDHFGRSFRLALRTSPMRHLKQRRLQHAGRLLVESCLPVAAIGEMVGFADPLHFSREFRRGMGTSPRGWRLRQGG